MAIDATHLESVAGRVKSWQQEGQRVGLVHGAFDLLHSGHIALIERAAQSSDRLVVALFDDSSTRVLKGPGRPFTPERERARLVGALRDVDAVVIVDGLSLAQEIGVLGPDMIFTADDDCPDVPFPVSVLPELPGVSASQVAAVIAEGVDFPVGQEPFRPSPAQSDALEFSFSFAPRGRTDQTASRVFTFAGAGPDDLIFGTMREYGTFYEIDVLTFLHYVVRRRGVAIDVGANIGNHTVYLSAYLADLVIALEPVSENYRLLQHNLAANGLTSVVALRVAAGSKAETAVIHRPPGWERNAGSIQVRAGGKWRTDENAQTVEVRTIDDIIDELAARIGDMPITLLKVDVEGNEHAVLRGAARTIETHRPVIAAELVHDFTFNAVNAHLGQLGYRPIARFGNPVPLYIFRSEATRGATPAAP
ncbi:MAG: pantoate--beta-alanine ligase [Thermomicrobiales bacterium]|nr:pantoate--beta-alanine ligase [Thermomicrobiales bacterium]